MQKNNWMRILDMTCSDKGWRNTRKKNGARRARTI